jgi:acyl carrier protein
MNIETNPKAQTPRGTDFKLLSIRTPSDCTALHQRLGADIPESEAAGLATIAAAVAYISSRRRGP